MEAFPAHPVLCKTDLIPKWEHHETKKRFKRARNCLKMLSEFDTESALWHKYIIPRRRFYAKSASSLAVSRNACKQPCQCRTFGKWTIF
jgi:hypothetical protein